MSFTVGSTPNVVIEGNEEVGEERLQTSVRQKVRVTLKNFPFYYYHCKI